VVRCLLPLRTLCLLLILVIGNEATPSRAANEPALSLDLKQLQTKLKGLRPGSSDGPSVRLDRWADVAVFAKGAEWAVRYESRFSPANRTLVLRALSRGRERAAALMAGEFPWERRTGRVVRGYVSEVDGSVQPFGLIIPAGYDSRKPIRLDVVLHGSTRAGKGLTELKFMRRFDSDRARNASAPAVDYIELHPLGRVENCYRWAGQTDVFEAIEAVCRHYNIDRDRIVLRGMSMGASGTWHLGLKYPDRFVALGPWAGYVDTHHFSESLTRFIKVGPLPPHQEAALHMLDSVDYAANAGVVPAVACMGEKDPFFQSHVLMRQAMAREGLKMVNLIASGVGHRVEPTVFGEQMRRIAAYAKQGLNHRPRKIRFVTWTLKYSRCHWLQLLGLRRHYRRAEIRAHLTDKGSVEVDRLTNITRFTLRVPSLRQPSSTLRIAGRAVVLPRSDRPAEIVLAEQDGRWVYRGGRNAVKLTGKRPGLQGPIDDAFTTRFLCVRGTGKPWNPAVQAWSEANLRRFAYEWNRYFRGTLPIKDDTQVTPTDLQNANLILFGDPGSNLWIARLLPRLPIVWTRDELRMGKQHYAAADHAPALIVPNPLAGAGGRYVVINSGHTFHEKELGTYNYLLFPRHGDWAVFRVGRQQPATPTGVVQETVLRAGFLNEQWQFELPTNPSKKTTGS